MSQFVKLLVFRIKIYSNFGLRKTNSKIWFSKLKFWFIKVKVCQNLAIKVNKFQNSCYLRSKSVQILVCKVKICSNFD